VTSVEAEYAALARSVHSLADCGLRATYLRHMLLARPADQVADLFTVAMLSAESRQPLHTEILQAMSLALADDACASLREAVRGVLEAREQPSLALALQRLPVHEESATQRVPDFGKGRTVTLGERKSLARTTSRELITRVLRDPNPQVMHILLGNPLLTETDLVTLCARRPVSTAILREVFRSPRWIVRYPIKVTLALNPYTPLDVALQLAPHLQLPDLRRLIGSDELHEALREASRRLLGRTESTTVH
jgi:hypothetical protein